jgi:GGDEF domain-containing protein
MFEGIRKTLKERKEQREEGRKLYHETFEKEFRKERVIRLREAARKNARQRAKQSASRYGGSRFGINISEADKKTAKNMMGNFAASLEQNPFGSSKASFGGSASDPFGLGGLGKPSRSARRKHKASHKGKQIVIKL